MNDLLQKIAAHTPRQWKPLARRAHADWRVLRHNIRAAARWRGQRPRVYLHHTHPHSVWRTYWTHPPLRYAPYPIAELSHWVGSAPARFGNRGHIKSYLIEIEHILVMAEKGDWSSPGFMQQWHRVFDDAPRINARVGHPRCGRIVTFSAGLVEHSKRFLAPDLWPKLDFLYPAFPAQAEYERPGGAPFNILVIASRFSDKGVPEAVRTFDILRERHGEAVRMDLVCSALPEGFDLPPGITLWNVFPMSDQLKARLYQSADVLLLPCYSETAACFPEAYAFGVPVITTRIHHGDEFVREGITGHLLHTPIWMFSDDFGQRWKTSYEFLDEVVARRERGELETIVEQSVEHLEAMIAGRTDLASMRVAARRFHAESFSLRARNRKLRHFYRELHDAGSPINSSRRPA